MKGITTVGLDLAKNVFQVHAVDENGAVLVRRQVRRAQVLLFFSRLHPCLIGIEACAGEIRSPRGGSQPLFLGAQLVGA